MPAETQKIVFARVNRRRQDGQETLANTSFREDMLLLAEGHQTAAVQRSPSDDFPRTWFAGDMRVEPDGNYLTGALGYTSPDQYLRFDDKDWSWVKAQPEESDSARQDTISPFAIDLRDRNRWVAFAPTFRLRNRTFTEGLELVLNAAASEAGAMPTEWEIDLVVSRDRIDEWLLLHPLVYRLTRTIKFTNPGRDLDADRQEMRALAARRKTEDYAASSGGTLNTTSEQFRNKLDGLETGDIDLRMAARDPERRASAVFNSKVSADEVIVDSFGGDLILGMELVLLALREYVAEKSRVAEGL